MSPSYIPELHDVGLLRSDGTTKVGLMLARDPKTNQPIYRTVYDDYFVNRAYASALDYAATDPQRELRLIYSDWRRGFGQYIFDSGDPKRYYSSIGCDLRFKDRAIAGPVATGIALPTYGMKITDPGLETWTDANTLTNWTLVQVAGTVVLSRNDTSEHSGTYCASIACDNLEEGYIKQVLATWNNNYQSKTVNFKYWGMSAANGYHYMVITDGVDTTTQASQTDAAMTEYTVSHTFNAAATKCEIRLVAGASGGSATSNFDGLSTDLPYTGAIVARANFNDLDYLAGGNILWKGNATWAALTFVESFFTAEAGEPTSIITDLAVHGSYLYIARGTSLGYYYMDTAEAFTASNAAVNTYQYFCTVYTTAQTLYGNDSANTIRSTANPLNGGTAWSGQTTVGSSADAITDMIQKSGALYIMKEDMPYYLNSAGAVQNDLAPECASLNSSTSGKNVIEWLKNLYIPVGTQGLLETDGTTNTWRNPASYSTNLGDFVGRVQALAADEEWLFAIVDNSTKVEVLAGREETIDGTTEWVWHPICEITLTGAGKAWVSSVYQKRLWIASTSSSDSLYYIPLPTGYGNVTADTNRAFQTNSYFVTPFYHAGFKGDTKRFIKVVATLGHAYDANVYWECWYKKLEDSSFTDAGDLIGTTASRIATLFLPVDGSSNKPTSTMMQFKLVAKTNDTTKTPVLLGFDVRAVLYPAVREIIECEVLSGDFIHDREGNLLDGTSGAYVETVLDEARDSIEPFSFYDPWGSTLTVKMLPSNPYSFVTYDKSGENKEQHFNLRLQKVALS